jgi:CHAT domain-containing protein
LASLGRLEESESLHRSALEIDSRVSGSDTAATAGDLNNLAFVLDYENRHDEAEAFFRRALTITQALNGVDDIHVASLLNNLGYNLDAQRRYVEAEPYYRRSLAIFQAYPSKQTDISRALDDLGVNLDAQGRYAEAEPFHREALRIDEGAVGKNHPELSATLNNLAVNLDAQGRHIEAHALLTRALTIDTARLGSTHPTTAAALANLALSDLNVSRYSQAVEHAQAALEIREGILAGIAPAESSSVMAMRLSSAATAFLLLRAEWAYQIPHRKAPAQPTERAFEAAQLVRYTSSADALAAGSARIAAEKLGAGSLVADWHSAQLKLSQIDKQITDAANQAKAGDELIANLAKQRLAELSQLRAKEAELKSRFPSYFNLISPQPVPLEALRPSGPGHASLLRSDEVLLLLTPGNPRMPKGDRNGFVFAVSQTNVSWTQIPYSPDQLRTRVRLLHQQLEDGGTTDFAGDRATGVAYDRSASFELYKALFGSPAIRAVTDGKKRWIIAPQGVLLSTPFAALVTEAPWGGKLMDSDPQALRKTHWLGLQETLALIPSVFALRTQRELAHPSGNVARLPFFGLGDPALTGRPSPPSCEQVSQVSRSGDNKSFFRGAVANIEAINALPCLPNTASEIRSLADYLKSDSSSYVLQLDATEAEVRRRNADGRLGRADIIAFATHGLLTGDLENTLLEPALVVTPPLLKKGQLPTSDNDGLLTASEIATLTLDARFVILSACNTAAGDSSDADGLSGLARSFFYAGAQSLLVSQFAVSDRAAEHLTTETIRRTREGNLRSPEALRESMIALAKDESSDSSGMSYAHPSQWAPFIMIDGS